MDYEKLMCKSNPFDGLSLRKRKWLFVYMRYVVHPNLSVEEIEKRWGNVLPKEEYPPVFEALRMVDWIKWRHGHWIRSELVLPAPILIRVRLIFWGVFGIVWLFAMGMQYGEGFARKAKKAKREADRREFLLIEKEFFRNPCHTYRRLCDLELPEARDRRELCVKFGIGTLRGRPEYAYGCGAGRPDDYLGRAAQSEAFCESLRENMKSRYFPISQCDIEGLRLLRQECERFPQLRQCGTNLLYKIVAAGNANAAECLELAVLSERTGKLEEARSLYDRSAQLGDSQAILWMCNYWWELAVLSERTGKLEEARSLYDRSAKLGDSRAILWMCNYWWNRWERDDSLSVRENAVSYLGWAGTKLGDADIFMKLSSLHTGRRRVIYLRKAANLGNAEAAFKLGSIYATGEEGCVTNEVKSMYWYRIAARKGHKEAERELSKHGATLK